MGPMARLRNVRLDGFALNRVLGVAAGFCLRKAKRAPVKVASASARGRGGHWCGLSSAIRGLSGRLCVMTGPSKRSSWVRKPGAVANLEGNASVLARRPCPTTFFPAATVACNCPPPSTQAPVSAGLACALVLLTSICVAVPSLAQLFVLVPGL